MEMRNLRKFCYDTNATHVRIGVCAAFAKVCQPLTHHFQTTREHVFDLMRVSRLDSKVWAICNLVVHIHANLIKNCYLNNMY